MKLSDYSKVTELANDNIFLIDTVNGTRTITAEALLKAISDTFSPKDIFEKIDLSTISSAIELEDNDLVFLGRAGGNKTMNAKEFLKTLQLDFTKLTEAEQVSLTDKLLINDGTGNKSINIENLLKTLNFNVLTEVQEFAEDDNLIVSSPTEGNRKIPASQVGTKLDLNALPVAETAADNDLILLGTSEGNKNVKVGKFLKAAKTSYDILDDFIAPEARAGIFRGKNLGTSFTEEQSARIKDGTFKGFFLGDYWEDTVNNVKWRIADFDYWLSIPVNSSRHHLVIVPDGCIDTQPYNTSRTTDGGFTEMTIYKTGLDGIPRTKIMSFFGAHLMTYNTRLLNSMTNGAASSVKWSEEDILLLNEFALLGTMCFSMGSNGSTISDRSFVENTRIALFDISPEFIKSSDNIDFWLLDAVNNAAAVGMSSLGPVTADYVDNNKGIRPYFAIA